MVECGSQALAGTRSARWTRLPDGTPRRIDRHGVKRSRNLQSKILLAARTISLEEPKGADQAYLHSTIAQVGLPRAPAPNDHPFVRHFGKVSLRIVAGALWNGQTWVPQAIPSGTKPRLFLLDVSAEALRKNSKHVYVEKSFAAYLRRVGSKNTGGQRGSLTEFRKQIGALAAADVRLGVFNEEKAVTIHQNFIEGISAWVTKAGGTKTPWPREIVLSEAYFKSLQDHAVPLDRRATAALSGSALALDIYCWLAHRLHSLDQPTVISWTALKRQFGQEYREPKVFARNFRKQMKSVLAVYPQARVTPVPGGLELRPSPTPIKTKTIVAATDYQARK